MSVEFSKFPMPHIRYIYNKAHRSLDYNFDLPDLNVETRIDRTRTHTHTHNFVLKQFNNYHIGIVTENDCNMSMSVRQS